MKGFSKVMYARPSHPDGIRASDRSPLGWLWMVLLIGAFVPFPGNAAPSAPASPVAKVQADVEAARRDLSRATRRIADERTALQKQIRQAQSTLAALRQELQAARRRELRLHEQRASAEEQVARLREDIQSIDGLLQEFRRMFEMHLTPAWAIRIAPRLAAIDQILGTAEPERCAAAARPILDLANLFMEERVGGCRFRGQAVAPDGKRVSGTFADIGPLEYFAAQSEDAWAGVVVLRAGSSLPSVVAFFSPDEAAQVRRLAQTGRGRVPLDPTAGAAVKLQQTREPWWRNIEKGGIVMIPILALGAFCAFLAVLKIISLHRLRVRSAENEIDEILDALRSGDVRRATTLARGLRRPLGPVILEGIEHRSAPREHVEELMYERLLAQAPEIEKYLAALAVGASAAPLLGLLGTVTGMIHTFRLITVFGTGNPRVLASGIAEALITTEYGLAIAIPALLVHAYLSRKVRKTMTLTQQASARFMNGLAVLMNSGEPESEDGDAVRSEQAATGAAESPVS